MNVTNTIKGVANATKYTVTAPIIKEDYGLYLKIEGLPYCGCSLFCEHRKDA